MLKKRLIFTLLFDNGNYMLSRNFRLQRVGDLGWLKKNYVFSRIAFSIDELVILNVNWNAENEELFCAHLKELAHECFIPIAAGGGIRSVEQARRLLRSGADKVVINTPLSEDIKLIHELAETFGQQCIVGSVDIKRDSDVDTVLTHNGKEKLETSVIEYLNYISSLPVGEIYLNSIDRDGTGQGYRFEMLDMLPATNEVPVILAGGAGNWHHLMDGLKDSRIDAVATAHLFNFVGDGLAQARKRLVGEGIELATWDEQAEL
jgi:cyclase